MQKLDLASFEQIVKTTHLKPRFKRELKFVASTENMDWEKQELVAIWNKSRKGGLLFIQPEQELYVVPFEHGTRSADPSGRSKPVVCDLCYTWQASGLAGYVTFYPDPKSNNSTSFLCCYDLRCSDHVRGKSAAGVQSRAQLRENLDNDGRVERLKNKLQNFVEKLILDPIKS